MVDPDVWRARAVCRGLGPSRFYSDDPEVQAKAKSLCARCPVAGACADAGDEELGIWGGLTEQERTPGVRLVRRGPDLAVSPRDLAVMLAAADPSRPALAQVLAMTSVSTSTAYRYLSEARRLGLVEVRGGRLYPVRH